MEDARYECVSELPGGGYAVVFSTHDGEHQTEVRISHLSLGHLGLDIAAERGWDVA